jgi:hypothetical protein
MFFFTLAFFLVFHRQKGKNQVDGRGERKKKILFFFVCFVMLQGRKKTNGIDFYCRK